MILLQFLGAWFISSTVHELGHYFVARAYHIQVSKVAIWGGSRFGFHIGQCHFSVGIAPFFSYCKIYQLELTPRQLWASIKRSEYLAVIWGGVTAQLLTMFAVAILFRWGFVSFDPYPFISVFLISIIGNMLPSKYSDGRFLLYPVFGKCYYLSLVKPNGAVLSMYNKNGRWLTHHQVHDDQLYNFFQIHWFYFRFWYASKRRLAHNLTGYKYGFTGTIKINQLPC